MIKSKYGEGMTVGELREAMKDVLDETPVVGCWESIHVPLHAAAVTLTREGPSVFELDVDA